MRVETNAEWLFFTTTRIVTPSSIGTGAIIKHSWGEDLSANFVVTNKHVVQNTTSGTLTFTASPRRQRLMTPGSDLGERVVVHVKDAAWDWTGHPLDDVDITALPLTDIWDHLKEEKQYPWTGAIPTSIFPGPEEFEHMDAIEDVRFVGYPNGIYDEANNLPVVRRGSTATPLHVDYDGKPAFLMDASIFPGSSGSPVFLYNSGIWSDRGKAAVAGNRIYMLGILASVFFRRNDGTLAFEEIPSAVRPTVRTQEMIDLGIVYKARTVLETIEHLLRRFGEIPETDAASPQ